MKNYRYGKFRFRNFYASWFAIALLIFFSIASIILKLSSFITILTIVYAIAWLYVILVPHCEQFVLHDDSITVFHGKRAYQIDLPSELTLIVSYADICPPLTKYTAVGNKTHILKDQYAISILQKTPIDVALETLHCNYVHKYTTSRIQTIFNDYHYIYSFVCNHSLIDKLITSRQCSLIIPESLLQVVSIDLSNVSIHIDAGY